MKQTLYTLSLYGCSGVYTATLPASQALSLYAELNEAGAIVSLSRSP